MANEVIIAVSDLVGFDEKSLQYITNNLRSLRGSIVDPTHGALPWDTISTPPFMCVSKLQVRLEVASHLPVSRKQ